MGSCLHPVKVHGVWYNCMKCPACRQNFRQAKSMRFLLEMAYGNGSDYFVTLTYNDEHLPMCTDDFGDWVPCFHKPDVQLFMKRLRQDLFRKHDAHMKYFLVSEFGDIYGRSHYHFLAWLDKKIDILVFESLVDKKWKKGSVLAENMNINRVAYCAKYSLKESYENEITDKADARCTFRLWSNGIGESAVPAMNEYFYNDGDLRTEFYIDGNKVCLDDYFKRHIDPSIRAEIKAKTYERNLAEIQQNMYIAHQNNGKTMKGGMYVPDFTKDNQIIRRRQLTRAANKFRKICEDQENIHALGDLSVSAASVSIKKVK